MLFIEYIEPDSTKGIISWHVGERFPYAGFNHDSIVTLQADCDELVYIENCWPELLLPQKYTHVHIWKYRNARILYNKLRSKYNNE